MVLYKLQQNLMLNFHDPLTSFIRINFLPSQNNTGDLKIICESQKDREEENQ